MDAIKQQLLRIQQQLIGLSASQKMLTVSLVIIMIMTMFYWSHYASSSEMVALLDQPLSTDEIRHIESSLAAKNVKYEIVGNRINVPTERRFELLAGLGYDQALPTNTVDAFTDAMGKLSPLDGSVKTDETLKHAKEATLSNLIARWPNVKTAAVMIDATRKPSPSRPIQPTASIDIITKTASDDDRRLADSAVNLLTGAQAGLETKNVKVNINGRAVKMREGGDGFGGDAEGLDLQGKYEGYYLEKIARVLPRVAFLSTVMVEVNRQASTVSSHTPDAKNKADTSSKTVTTSSENGGTTTGGEPGVTPNVGVDNATTSPTPGSTYEKTESEIKTDTGFKDMKTILPGGDGVCVRASVRMPYSYFLNIWKMKNPTAKNDPTEAELGPTMQREVVALRGAVKSATNIKEDANIEISDYADFEKAPVEPTIAVLPTTTMFGAKDIAVGALAVISLFMVAMMVRKSAPATLLQPMPAGVGADASAMLASLNMGHNVAGEVREMESMLVGHELSDEAIESKQVIEQVGTMVKDNPEAAANLVKRWLNRE